MREGDKVPYTCPEDGTPLTAHLTDEFTTGYLESAAGRCYPVADGIVDFLGTATLTAGDAAAVAEYDRTADDYDRFLPIAFDTVCEDEMPVRRAMVAKLGVGPGATVLEVGCGTGRDTLLIADLLGDAGTLYAQDVSLRILEKCKAKFAGRRLRTEFARANASAIPLPDNCCDAVFHFGGLNTFTHLDRAFAELCRVTREGGRVVVGDEGIAPWLRDSVLGRVLMHNNPHYSHEAPLARIPAAARNVSVEWIFAGTFFVIAFEVSKKELAINLDLPIPGKRGGTHRTRYFGKLDGVTLEAKELALRAAQESGLSVHEWLDRAVRAAAAAGQTRAA